MQNNILNKKELHNLSLLLKENVVNSKIEIDKKNRFKYIENTLITGVTGNLGFEILNQIQSKNIYIILRKNNISSELNSLIINKNVKVFLSKGLEHENLGLEYEEYQFLVNKIDSIYHCAANVNNLLSMEDLYMDNVISTLNIIKFSLDKKIKLLNYMSTLSIYVSIKNIKHNNEIKQEPLKPNFEIPKNGYTATKIICDFLCCEINKEFNNIKIYRLGLLLGNNLSKKSYIYQLLKNIKEVPKEVLNYAFDLTPTNLAVKYILTNQSQNSIINVTLNEKVFIKDIVKYLNISIIKKEDFKRKGWMYEFIKEIYNQPVKHDIFEMTNIKSFEIEEELKKYSIKKEKYILNWLNVIQEN